MTSKLSQREEELAELRKLRHTEYNYQQYRIAAVNRINRIRQRAKQVQLNDPVIHIGCEGHPACDFIAELAREPETFDDSQE